ncbi:aldehyde dehydrogenase (NAD(P)+) [Brevibacterium siliguriense]|uniref:Aldehyde dehydrogenase (NAD(P)+) n=1 Tax=Brevibacterium siliguriense TaxID=1136497 RepID=A0A1H1WCZ4_9MICO|nr:aldehyde dehydrogenase family protein [Brevibacterium siliguriense]SDS94862.1 aldehyde dehydrogenase (NAD(P)+) [Brevibacterium siliguriense]
MTTDYTAQARTEAGPPSYPLDADRLDDAISSLESGVKAWADMPLHRRARLLERTHESIADNVVRWTRTASDLKKLPTSSQLVGEEWMSGPYAALSGFYVVAKSLHKLASGHSTVEGLQTSTTPEGRLTWKVLPIGLQEAVLFHGFSAKVWTLPGVTADEIHAGAGLGATELGTVGGVSLILGAGNITSIGPLDALTELVAHNRASILKINPTLAPLLSVYREALQPLIDADLLRIVQGGTAVGEYLSNHPHITHVHITGSAATHDRIVWGNDNTHSGEPVLKKPITSELGGVSPVIVVPGEWSKADLRFQAENIASMRLHNAGHNCIAAQTVIIDAKWSQREEFLRELAFALEDIDHRDPWYPGSRDKLRQAAAEHSQAEAFSHGQRLLITLDSDQHEAVETTEYFTAVLGVKPITVDSPVGGIPKSVASIEHVAAFLGLAVDYANNRLAGTLGANVIVSPATRRSLGPRFDAAIERLHFGSIGINVWTGLAFLTATATWGAFPGHTLHNVQSGIGVVHNGLLIPHSERTVVSGPFRPFPRSILGGEFSLFPKPPWFVTARSAARTGRALTEFAANPCWAKLPGIFYHAFQA